MLVDRGDEMKSLLRKILGIQTLKLVVINPSNVRVTLLTKELEGLPIRYVISHAVEDVRVIDTGIIVKK